MEKNSLIFYFICFFLQSSMLCQAQVKVHIDEPSGVFNEEDFCAFSVSSFVGVEIDFKVRWQIYKNSEVIHSVYSPTISHPAGLHSYSKDDFENVETLFSDFDFKSQKDTLELEIQLVHPQDIRSIIALNKVFFVVKGGFVLDEDGNKKINSKLISIQPIYQGDTFFKLPDRFNVEFENNNDSKTCSYDLEIEIKTMEVGRWVQLHKTIIEKLCLPEGKTRLSEAAIKRAKVLKDNYEKRSEKSSIEVGYTLVNSDVRRASYYVSPFKHTNISKELVPYISEPLNTSISFPKRATVLSDFKPDHILLHFDNNDQILYVELLISFANRYLSSITNNIFGFNLSREDMQGIVLLSVFDKNNLSEKQWYEFLKKRDLPQLITLSKGDIKIHTPKNLKTIVKKPHMDVKPYQLSTVIVEYGDKYFIYGVKDFDKPLSILNTIEINGKRLHFEFDENEQIKDILLKDGVYTKQKTLAEWKDNLQEYIEDYYQQKQKKQAVRLPFDWHDESKRNREPKFEEIVIPSNPSPFPNMEIIYAHDKRPELKGVFENADMALKFNYHIELIDTNADQNMGEFPLTFTYDDEYKITGTNEIGFVRINPALKQKELSFKPKRVAIRSSANSWSYFIAVTKISLQNLPDEKLLKSIAMFYEMEGGIRSSKLEEFKLGSYTIFTPTIRSRNKNNATIISDGINAWIFRLRTDRSLQIEDILNSIEINGQGFQFTYHGNELVDVKLQK